MLRAIASIVWLIIGWVSLFAYFFYGNPVLVIIAMLSFSTTTILTLCDGEDE